jgi:hydrogenase nickel incorporation protein HypA/HybF
MHELGIAEAVLTAIQNEGARFPDSRIIRVGLRIGELAGVDAEALRFAFEAVVLGSEFEPLRLEIEFCPRRQQCRGCGQDFVVHDYNLRCPNCHGFENDCIGGDELDLAFVEVEEYAAS